jgi:glycerol-3-phosphate acyltransferase PlsY
MGLWLPTLPIVLAAGALIWFTLGIASITTIAIGLVVTIVFGVYSSLGVLEPVNIWYGVIAELFLIWALRPNIKKLLAGKERVVKFSLNGWLRARKEAQAELHK